MQVCNIYTFYQQHIASKTKMNTLYLKIIYSIQPKSNLPIIIINTMDETSIIVSLCSITPSVSVLSSTGCVLVFEIFDKSSDVEIVDDS